MKTILSLLVLLCLTACQNVHSVITTSQTCLGVSVSENPSTQLYEARLGYCRNEFAYVPANTNDMTQIPDVMMELRIVNIFAGGGVYQRLCVGQTAVAQPGASLMFAKDPRGNFSTNAVLMLQQQLHRP